MFFPPLVGATGEWMFTLRQRPKEHISQCDGVQVSFLFFFSLQRWDRAAPLARCWTCDPAGDAHRPSRPLSPRPTGRARQPPPVPPCHPSSRLRHRGSITSVTVTCLSVESDSCCADASNLARGISVCAQHTATPISPAEGNGGATQNVLYYYYFVLIFFRIVLLLHLTVKNIKKLSFFFRLSWPDDIDAAGAELERCFGEPAHGAHLLMLIC